MRTEHTDYQQKQNGNMRAVREAQLVTVSQMTLPNWVSTLGSEKTLIGERILLARRKAMPGGCTTCTGMCRNGAATGTTGNTTRTHLRMTQGDLAKALAV